MNILEQQLNKQSNLESLQSELSLTKQELVCISIQLNQH